MSRGKVGIGRAKVVFHAITKEQFVAKNFFVGGEDGLTGHEIASPAQSRGARGKRSFGGGLMGLSAARTGYFRVAVELIELLTWNALQALRCCM